MRCDVNVSVRKKKQEEFGKRVEIKNMNSFSAMQKAIEYEIDRQARSPDILYWPAWVAQNTRAL